MIRSVCLRLRFTCLADVEPRRRSAGCRRSPSTLIRSLHDRGLLVLLDNRILKKQYGRTFVESLPDYKKTTDLRVVETFFGVGS